MTYHCQTCDSAECRACQEKEYPTDWTRVRDGLSDALGALSTPTGVALTHMWETINKLREQADAKIGATLPRHSCGHQEST